MAPLDPPGRPGEPEPPERRGKSNGDSSPDRSERGHGTDRTRGRVETEQQAAERLGLTTLTRGAYFGSQQAKAEAQEAAIRRGDTGTRREVETASDRHAAPPASGETRDSVAAGRTGGGPADGPGRDVEGGRGYWAEVARFLGDWRRIADRWPLRQRSEPREAMAPEHRAKALESVDKVAEAEPPISRNIKKVEVENTCRGWLEGFAFRLKGRDRLMEKISEGRETSSPDATVAEIAQQIPDAIRYTFCFESRNYSSGYWDVKERLEGCGYEMYYSKNSWTDAEYKGINTRWVTPEGQRFEAQFHTRESFHAKHELTHEAYERIRNPVTSEEERRELSAFQREVSSWIPVPGGVTSIPDYKKKGFLCPIR